MRFCNKCNQETERYKDGRCSVCARARAKARYHKNPESNKAKARAWKQANKAQARVYGRKGGRKDWQPGEHEKAEEALKVAICCDVCGSSNPRHKRGWNADHDHSTGLFRGIVCHPCNIAISHVEKFGLDRGKDIEYYLGGDQ